MSNSLQHSLDEELQAIEKQLSNMAPQSLSPDVLGRMNLLMGQWGDPQNGSDALDLSVQMADGDLTELEVHLDQLSPVAMSDGMLARMSLAMDRWQQNDDSLDEKIIPLIHSNPSPRAFRNIFSGGMLSAAAAVAVMGAIAALVMPRLSSPQTHAVAESAVTTPVAGSHQDSQAAPASRRVASNQWDASDALSHNVVSTRDSGVVFSDDNIPHRCIRIDYVDKIKVIDKQGREIEIKTPGVNYMLIPVETN